MGICRNHQGIMGVSIKEHVGDYFEKLSYCLYFLHNSMDMGSLSGSIFRIRFRTIPKCKRDPFVRCSGSQHKAHIDSSSYVYGSFSKGKTLNGHVFFIRDYIWDYSKIQEGPLCPLFLSLHQAAHMCMPVSQKRRPSNTAGICRNHDHGRPDQGVYYMGLF